MTEFDKKYVEEILGGHGDWFTAYLFRLIQKADAANREKLRKGFPEEVSLVESCIGHAGGND